MFCFGRRCPLTRYLDMYDEIDYVIIIGDEDTKNSATTPNCLDMMANEAVLKRRIESDILLYVLPFGTPQELKDTTVFKLLYELPDYR